MNNKKVLNLLTIILLIGLVVFSVFRFYRLDEENEEAKEEAQKTIEKERAEKEESEIEEGYIIVTRTTYKNNTRLITRLYSTGELERCALKDEPVIASDYKESYAKIGNVTEEELKTIKTTIEKMSSKGMRKDGYSNSYGIAVKTDKNKDVLYSAEYYDQADVNTIYNILNKY